VSPADIDAANAAIRLGDPVLPPVGTVLAVPPMAPSQVTRAKVINVVVACDDSHGHAVARSIGAPRPVDTMAKIVRPGDGSYQVVSVPDDAPPFALWWRPTGRARLRSSRDRRR